MGFEGYLFDLQIAIMIYASANNCNNQKTAKNLSKLTAVFQYNQLVMMMMMMMMMMYLVISPAFFACIHIWCLKLITSNNCVFTNHHPNPINPRSWYIKILVGL